MKEPDKNVQGTIPPNTPSTTTTTAPTGSPPPGPPPTSWAPATATCSRRRPAGSLPAAGTESPHTGLLLPAGSNETPHRRTALSEAVRLPSDRPAKLGRTARLRPGHGTLRGDAHPAHPHPSADRRTRRTRGRPRPHPIRPGPGPLALAAAGRQSHQRLHRDRALTGRMEPSGRPTR